MENAFTCRFEATTLMSQLQALGAVNNNHLLITFYLEVNPTKEAVMKAKSESFRQSNTSSPSTPTGDTRVGCPVPPCALLLESQDPECLQLVDEILKFNNIT